MIKKIFSLSVIAVSILLFIFSCDKVEHPYINVSSSNQVSDTSCVFPAGNPNVYRKIFLEDYTGHLCGTCPPATAALYGSGGLKQTYGDTLISIGVHASLSDQFTEPCPPHAFPSGASAPAYAEDFRTPAGDAWRSFYGIILNPQGMVSRIGYPTNTHKKAYSTWGGAIQSLIGTPPQVEIQIINTYDSVSGNLNICIKSIFLSALAGTYKMCVILTEDSIKGWQEDYSIPPTPPLYQNDTSNIYRHVLRGAINSDVGDTLQSGTIALGDTVRKAYSVNLLTVPSSVNNHNPVLNTNRCSVVAFVYDDATKEILQAEEEKVR